MLARSRVALAVLRSCAHTRRPASAARSASSVGRACFLSSHGLPGRHDVHRDGADDIDPTRLPEDPELVRRSQESSRLHLVFLEGAACTGKSMMCKKLERMGFCVHYENFVELCQENPHLSPQSVTLSLKWMHNLQCSIEKFWKMHAENPEAFRHNVVFLDRSFYSPFIYNAARGPTAEMAASVRGSFGGAIMNELRHIANASVIFCESDPYAINVRLRQRFDASPEQTKSVRKLLGELDMGTQTRTAEIYRDLYDGGLMDARIDTSVPKLGLLSLLGLLGVRFAPTVMPWTKAEVPKTTKTAAS